MKKRVMVTTLFDCERAINKAYFSSKGDNGKTLYCDAMMPVEAACKFVLATYQIDEIIVIDYENEDKPSRDSGAMVLREGKTFFSSDLKTLSDFDLLRYRLAEYVEEVYAEDQDDNALITGEEQKKAIAFLRRFFSGRIREQPDNRMNRYFHILAQDYSLQTALDEELRAWAPEWEYERYKTWVCHYLYQRLKETGKMELLEGNRDVRIRLVSVNRDESFMLAEYMPGKGLTIEGSDGEDGTELLLFIENADAAEVLDVFNIINMTKVIPSNRFNINRMFTATNYSHLLANVIMDRTKVLSISELLSGASAFMNYGKTGSIVKYWKQCGVENTKIDQMIYAMRNIDTGISLCDINDIERGIKSLRSVIEDREPIGGDTTVEHFFAIFLQEGIRKDYGRLLETDEIQFIDLVRWAYRKEFWQQTLTLIESRAPRDFVDHGFFYYCDSEDSKEKAVKIFGQIYFDLKPHEKFKIEEDTEHYYIKYYNRFKASHQKKGNEYFQDLAKARVSELDTENPGEIRAHTVCKDRSALENLLFSYYYMSDVRNETNHAMDSSDAFYDIMKESDSSERMDLIRQSIKYFLHCYDNVMQAMENKEPNVIKITYDDYADYVEELRNQARSVRR